MKEFIIFVCTDSTEIFLSKLRSSCSNYNLPSFITDSFCAGVSNKHCLLTLFIEVGIPNSVCGCILGWQSVAYHFRVTVTFTSDLVFRIIVSGAYLILFEVGISNLVCGCILG